MSKCGTKQCCMDIQVGRDDNQEKTKVVDRSSVEIE